MPNAVPSFGAELYSQLPPMMPLAPCMFCDDDVGIAGDVPAHVAGQQAGVEIVAGRHLVRDDERDLPALVEIRDRIGHGNAAPAPPTRSQPAIAALRQSSTNERIATPSPFANRRRRYPVRPSLTTRIAPPTPHTAAALDAARARRHLAPHTNSRIDHAAPHARPLRPESLRRRPRLQQPRLSHRRAGRPRRRAPRARCGHHAVRHRRRVRRARRLGDHARPDPGRAPQGHRAGQQVRHGDGRGRPAQGRLAPLHHDGRRGEPEASRHRLARPLPAAPSRPGHADRGDDARARRSRARRQGPLHRLLEPAGVAGRRCAMDRADRRPRPIRLGAGRVQPRQPVAGEGTAAGAAGAWHGAAAVLSAVGRAAHGEVHQRPAAGRRSPRQVRAPGRAQHDAAEAGDRRKAGGLLPGARPLHARARDELARRPAPRRQHHRRRQHARAGRPERRVPSAGRSAPRTWPRSIG